MLIGKHRLRRDMRGELPQRIGELRDRILLGLEVEAEPMEDAGDEANTLEAIERAMAGEAPADSEDPSDYPEAA